MQHIESHWGREPIDVDDVCPTRAIRLKLGRVHVGRPDSEVESMVREAVAEQRRQYNPDWTGPREEEAVRFALWQHHENRAEYAAVMSGWADYL